MLETLTIFLLALLSMWAAVGLGLALGMNPVTLVLVLALANAAAALVVIHVGAPLCDRLMARSQGRFHRLIVHVFKSGGLVGLALVAPVATGAAVGTALGIAFQVPPRRLVLAIAAGSALWSLLLVLFM